MPQRTPRLSLVLVHRHPEPTSTSRTLSRPRSKLLHTVVSLPSSLMPSMHPGRASSRILELEQSFVQFLSATEQLACVADLTGVAWRVAALDQGEHFLRRLDMKPDAIMEVKQLGDRRILELQRLPLGRRQLTSHIPRTTGWTLLAGCSYG